jgi:hypothetical protein
MCAMKLKIAEIYPVEYWLSSTLNIRSHSLSYRKYGPLCQKSQQVNTTQLNNGRVI